MEGYKHSIKGKLIVSFFVISIVPIIIVGVFSSLYSYSSTEKNVGRYFGESVEQSMKNIDFLLKRIEEDSVQIVSSPDIQKGLSKYDELDTLQREELKKSITATIRNIYNSRQDIVNIEIMATNISLLIPATLDESLIDPKSYRESIVYRKGLEANGAAVWLGGRVRKPSEGKIWSIGNKTILEFSRCIKNYTNMEKIGVIAVEIKESAIEDFYKSLKTDDSETVFIVNSEGIIVSHPDKSMIGKNCDFRYIQGVDKTANHSYYSMVIDGRKMLIYSGISEITGWKLVRAIPYDKFTKQSSDIAYATLIVVGVFIVVSIILSVIFSYGISKPILAIVQAMYRIKEGKLDVRVNLKNNDEVGFLGENFNQMVSKIDELFKGIKGEEKKKREAEFRALQAQISPHFLLNLLNSLRFFAIEKKQKKIADITGHLVELLRSSFSLKEFVTIEEEINLIKNYVSIQEFRYNIPINIEYDIDESLLKCKILKFLLQPLVENSIIHGIDVFSGEGTIKLSVVKVDENIIIRIADNGKGMEESELIKYKFSGFAINNIEERIKLFFGDNYGMDIKSKPGEGVVNEILIPVIF